MLFNATQSIADGVTRSTNSKDSGTDALIQRFCQCLQAVPPSSGMVHGLCRRPHGSSSSALITASAKAQGATMQTGGNELTPNA